MQHRYMFKFTMSLAVEVIVDGQVEGHCLGLLLEIRTFCVYLRDALLDAVADQ